ncbi:MAG TPA: hypothetical protein VEZ90_07905, partial [Blastocatellia bacterium]|nr:hypothetical protein [Blastocatellia bacterium]
MTDRVTFRRGQAVTRVIFVLALICTFVLPSQWTFASQDQKGQKDQKDQQETKKDAPPPTNKEIERIQEKLAKAKGSDLKLTPGEIIAETSILAYGGRVLLKTAHAAMIEQGRIRLATDQGDVSGTYMLRRVWKEKSADDLLRTDIELDTPEEAQKQGAPKKVKYVLGYNGASVWAAQNGQYITPTPESVEAFKSQLTHDFTTLLRYKEDGAKVDYIGQESVVGIDTNIIELTAANGEKTRFWVSARSYHILHMAYDLKLPDGTTRKFK